MSVRKVFSSFDKELSYRINSHYELIIEIIMADGTIAGIALDTKDAVQLIQELNKLRRELSDK
jgi:hypothetical protein